ncbi:MAG: YceI family protein [Bacteroidales bacterium]|nr:YceI family protein [Bacteroidales bacterium]
MSQQTYWISDPKHSEILFKVKHMMITNVKGEFRKFHIEAVSDGEQFIASSIRVVVDTASVFTNVDDRDNHLRSADFFDVENHKELVFNGSSLKKTGDDTFELTGILDIRGVSKEVKLDIEFGGINKDPWGNEKAGFSISGKINRKDWGLNWNAALEAGGVLVSDEVKISAEVQLEKRV